MNQIKSVCLLTIIVFGVFFTACSANNSSVNEIREIADTMTENILVAMNEDNYLHFSKDFDEPMKNALNEKEYQETIPAIKDKIGNYISKEFVSIEKKDQYTIIIYKAKFDQEPDDVIIRTVLSENNGNFLISGFWVNSPKLQNK